jgi:hypothetical protein
MEAILARTARHLAIPANARNERNPPFVRIELSPDHFFFAHLAHDEAETISGPAPPFTW